MDANGYFSGEHGYQGEWLYVYDLCGQTQDEKTREKMCLNSPLKFRYSVEAYWVKDIHSETTEQYVDKKGKMATRTKKDQHELPYGSSRSNLPGNAKTELSYILRPRRWILLQAKN